MKNSSTVTLSMLFFGLLAVSTLVPATDNPNGYTHYVVCKKGNDMKTIWTRELVSDVWANQDVCPKQAGSGYVWFYSR